MLKLIGLLGSIILAICGFPLAIKAFKEKRSSLDDYTLSLWFSGETLTLIYVILIKDYILTLNYILNFLVLCVIIFYRFRTWKRNAQKTYY